jgi:monofunctional glycosyltransferase
MKSLLRWLVLVLAAALALQLFFVFRIALMAWFDPPSTSLQRSQAWQILQREGQLPWRQQWVDEKNLPDSLRRAVIAAEDSTFTEHNGVWWESIEKAWARNQKAQARAERQSSRQGQAVVPRLVGGSTITQQLAKNLLLSGERNLLRKGQELVLTLVLEALLDKRRILTLYLNSVEWGEGVFGAEAAAWHYFRKPAARLSAWEAARLAVMLPRPRHFENRPGSVYLQARAQTIMARMHEVRLP